MTTPTILNEGLSAGDLNGVIDSTVIIDFFKPKFGDERRTLVVAFVCEDERPAQDLCSFIQHGTYDIFDVDHSPAPDESGKYLVFVELDRNRRMFDSIDEILSSCAQITNHSEWTFIPYTYVEKLQWSKENFTKTIPQMPHLYGHDLSDAERERIRKRIQFLDRY